MPPECGPDAMLRTRVAVLLGAELVVMAALLGVVLDQYAHKRVQSLAGVNSWGYRGAVMPGRVPGEIRIALVGGDRAFGWGVAPEEATSAYLRLWIQVGLPATPARTVTAVNLGALGLPARDYAGRIEQFRYLAPDIMCLYIDLIDHRAAAVLPPADSAVTALTGYVPMLPLVLEEKGDGQTDRGRWIVGGAVSAAGRILRAADRTAGRIWLDAPTTAGADRGAALGRALDAALASAAAVVAVLPMPFTTGEVAAHREALELVRRRAASEPRMRIVDLGQESRLADPALRLDAVNFGAGGHSLAAAAIAPTVSELMASVLK